MTQLAVLLAALGAGGAVLLLADLRWFRRPPLGDRVRPYAPVAGGGPRPSVVSVGSFRDVIGPACRQLGDRLASAVGVQEDVGRRLDRLHLPVDPVGFRLRQTAWAAGAAGVGVLVTTALGLGGATGLLFLAGSPLLAFLVTEQRLAGRSDARKQQLLLELPVVAEQLAMLLGAGYSLGAALNRLAERGAGAASADLGRVVRRIRQGLDEQAALQEWADIADLHALHRLVRVLALDHEASDVGRLVAAEARIMRREAHRRLVESIERRAQQVWVPVTVAALLPGALFLAVPFVDALSLITGD
jgi:tight adherence protein C